MTVHLPCVAVELAPPDIEVMGRLSSVFALSQLKFYSLRALPVCLQRPGFIAAITRARMLPVLLTAALEPLRVPTLLTLQSLGALVCWSSSALSVVACCL